MSSVFVRIDQRLTHERIFRLPSTLKARPDFTDDMPPFRMPIIGPFAFHTVVPVKGLIVFPLKNIPDR
jgi:hypothetical protein